MVLSYDLSSEIFLKKKIKSDHPNPPNPPTGYHSPTQVRKANFYNCHPMSMKLCMEVTFGGIQLIVDQG